VKRSSSGLILSLNFISSHSLCTPSFTYRTGICFEVSAPEEAL
jgi:hypothetical protein